MRKHLYSLLLLLFCSTLFSQPANDNCSGAQSLGNLPTPANCPSGAGVAVSVSGTINGATPTNPYIYQTGCSGAGGSTMAVPANDVWYSFTATGYQCVITINSTFANPNVALYAGNCSSLGGGVGGCAVGAGGSVTLTVEQMTIGTTYYIQVSGGSGQTGTFTMTVKNNKDCADCLTSATLTANPPPVNGMYQPGQTVNFCFKINNYNQVNANWLHGVQVSLGAGWNAATITPTSTPPACQGTGQWLWLPSCTSTATGQTFGQGWYFDTNDAGTNPGNNFGDNCSGNISAANWNFCFSVTTNTACASGVPMTVTLNTSGDGESGSWSSLGCFDDPPVTFNAVSTCCPPTIAATPATCGQPNGTATCTPPAGGGPFTYNWTGPSGYSNTVPAQAGASTVTGLLPGTYTCVVTNAYYCAQTATVTVGNTGTATATAANTGPYCPGGTIQLNASAGTSWNWSGPNSFASTLQNPTIPSATTAMSGVYSVTVNASGCTAVATTTVTVNPAPTATANNGGPYCAGSTISLTSSGGTGYSWSGPNSYTSPVQNPSIAAATTAMSGVYTVTVTANSCTSVASTTVTVNPVPTPTASNTGPYCPGATVQLSGGGGGTYSWTGPNSFGSSLQNPTIPNATSASAGVYTLTVNSLNCTATATTTVTINSVFTPSLTSNSPVCEGTVLNLSSLTGTVWNWAGPNSFSSSQQNPVVNPVTLADAGVYTATVTNAQGCSGVASLTVTVNALPVANAANTGPYCEGNAISLSASGGATYSWSGPNSFSDANQNPVIANSTTTMSGVYTVTVSSAAGCTATASTTVTVNPVPVPTAANTGAYCEGSTILLSAGGGTIYSWSGPNSFTDSNQNPTLSNSTNSMSGVYTVTVTAQSCSAAASTTVTVNPLPVPVISASSPVCEGDTLSFVCSNGITWSWSGPNSFSSSIQNPQIQNALPVASGTYSISITDVNGCVGSGTVAATVNPLPVITTVSDTICLNANGTITAAGASTYSWVSGTTPANAATVSASPSATTVYTVTGTDSNGCSNAATATITVNPLPVVSVNSPSVCPGTSAGLTAAGANSYTWSTGTTPAAGANVTVTPAATTQYTVTGTDLNGCSSTAVSTVTVANTLIVDAGQNDTVCNGNSVTLNATGPAGISYSWSTGATTQSVTVTAAATSTYTVTGTDAIGCTGTDTIQIVVPPTMTLSIGGFPTTCNGVCDGQAVVLANPNTGTFANYTYVWTNGATTPAANNLCAGSYSVIVADAAGCIASSSVTVTQPAAVTATATGITPTTCNGACNGSVTISSGGGTGTHNYSWVPTGTGSSPNNLCAGSYTCTVTDANGCTTQVPVVITEPAAITVSVTPVNTICIGQTATLTAVAGGGNGGYVYNWTGGTTPTTGAAVTAGPTTNSSYTVTVTDVNGCPSATAVVTVNVNPPLTVFASSDVTVCAGSSTALTATASGGNGVYTYAWSPLTVPANQSSVSATPSVTTTYTVTVTDGCGTPPATDNVIVSVNPLPVISITTTDPTGCEEWCVTFTANSNPASASCNWSFTDGQTSNGNCNPVICFATAGTYGATLSVTDINGCSNTVTNNNIVTVYSVPVAEFDWTPQPATELNPTVYFTDLSTNGLISSRSWSFGDAADNSSSQQNPNFTYINAGSYEATLVVVTDNGCIDSVTHTIVIEPEFSIYIPNAFTPNGDGMNEGFFPKGIGIDTENYEMWIYDRWGNMIWYNNDFFKPWDGKVAGKENIVQQDTYVWKIKLKNFKGERKSYVGHVTVVK